MPYSAVTQPAPVPSTWGGTRFSRLAVQRTWVSPKRARQEPSACFETFTSRAMGRSWPACPSVGAHGARIITAGGASAQPRWARPALRRAVRGRTGLRRSTAVAPPAARQAAIPAAMAPAMASCRDAPGRAPSPPRGGRRSPAPAAPPPCGPRPARGRGPASRPGRARGCRAPRAPWMAWARRELSARFAWSSRSSRMPPTTSAGSSSGSPARRSAFSRAATALAEASVASAERK